MTTSPWLTTGQAADRLCVSDKTVVRWAERGSIPHILTPGGHRRFRREKIEALALRLALGDREEAS